LKLKVPPAYFRNNFEHQLLRDQFTGTVTRYGAATAGNMLAAMAYSQRKQVGHQSPPNRHTTGKHPKRLVINFNIAELLELLAGRFTKPAKAFAWL
jgi:hypothetical protein